MSFLKNIKDSESGVVLWDGGEASSVPGLHFKHLKSGRKCFYVFYRARTGTQRRPKIGEWPSVPVSEARKRAKEILAQVVMGDDPKGRWDALKGEPTLGEWYKTAFKDYWSKEQFVKSGWDKKVDSCYKRHIEKRFEKYKLSEIEGQLVSSWHKKYVSAPVMGNHALSILSKLFILAKEYGHNVENPCESAQKHTTKSRKRYASENELKGILSILDRKLKDRTPKTIKGLLFLYTILYTGARPISITRGKACELVRHEGHAVLQFEGKSTAKTGCDETLIFPEALLNIYDLAGDTPFGSPMPLILWKQIQDELGCHDLWARDLRRTFATIGFNSGISRGVIGEVLNHRDEQTTTIYTKLENTTRVQCVKDISEKINNM